MRRMLVTAGLLIAPLLLFAGTRAASPGAVVLQDGGAAERTVWYFYRVKWGSQNEFLDLFRRNHYPVLAAQVGSRLVGVKTFVPTYHGDGRADWTFAVAITYRDTAAMVGPSNEAEIARKLFPDQARFQKEEQRRFELLDAHWDVPLNEVDMAP